jgi:septal ring factor EnvC (AmiA/AmiB activator)
LLPALLPVLAAAFWLVPAGAVHAAKQRTPDVQEKKAELDELKERIEALRKEVADAEESRADVADQLAEVERGISEANRRLRGLTEQRDATRRELTALESDARQLEANIAVQQQRLAHLLHRRYLNGNGDSLRLLLSGKDPNQVARDAYYLGKLSKGQVDLIQGLRLALDERQAIAAKIRDAAAQIDQIERSQQKERNTLLVQQEKRRAVLARISDDIKARRREISTLKRDEQRLGRLIEGLSRITRKPAPRPAPVPPVARAAAPSSSPEPPSAAEPAQTARQPTESAVVQPPSPPPAARNNAVPDDTPAGQSLSQLRGRLRLPVRGEPMNRFGAPRQDGGTTWKGLFIRTAPGVEVKAVAPGRVVFAEWLRGFGNLVILDHGESYLTVYGNNEAVLVPVGQQVQAGETIASVGNSGGSPDYGLYFELRHQGQPLDPMRWVNPR